MSRSNEKRFRQLKKSHTLLWLIVFTILIVLSCVLVAVFVSLYGSSIVKGKLDGEKESVRNMVEVYETCVREGTDPSPFLESFGRDYLILDTNGDILLPPASNTCVLQRDGLSGSDLKSGASVMISTIMDDATVYPDAEAPVISLEDHELTVDITDVFRNLDSYLVSSGKKTFSEAELHNVNLLLLPGSLFDHQEQMISIPLWIGIPMEDGQSELVAKCQLTFELLDLVLLIIFVTGIWLIVLTSYIVMMINLITGIARRRKTLKVFFTDAVTQGSNYMYFLYKGGDLIRKRRNRLVRFYVVNLSFIGYRNFCVCHSAEEGEKIISLIDQGIQSKLDRRKEICAHTAEADFALLLRADENEAVKARIQSVMDLVSHVTDDHVFVFQAGIETLAPVDKVAERKKIDLNEIYNIACAARESLDTEDPGIAFFDEKLVEDRRWAETVQDRQQAALEHEEFVVYYQPKYDPRTDELKGAEALIRWQSPEFGFVSPGRMIPIFEKNGFITEIDHYMLSHVARDQKRWLDAGYRCVPVSVNVSRAHFIESDLAEQIRDLVDAEGAPHELVEIELTESAFFDDKKALIHTIEKLKAYGFAVSMDDFGSGYSSLNSLKDMPLDVLKLDAEFFRGGNDGERGEIVVSEAINLAKRLDMRTVAEGIEVRDQVDFLAQHGCDMIQGYFYAKPMPSAEYEARMNERYRPKET